jgi:hypothetical protein
VNDVGGLFRDRLSGARVGDEAIDEFVHVPLTIPALRRVAIILNAVAAEHKRLARLASTIPGPRCVAATPWVRRVSPVVSRDRTHYKNPPQCVSRLSTAQAIG